jgi:anti-repressor protein
MYLEKISQAETVTSLELVKQINLFRSQEGNRSELEHKNLLVIIRDEFEDEIGRLKIQPSSYKNSQNKEQPMFELTISQAKQVLVRESKFVRKAIIAYLEKLENQLKVPGTYAEALLEAGRLAYEVEKANEQLIAANSTIKLLEPKRIFADAVSASKTTILVGELAKILKQNGIEIGQNRFFDWLRSHGYLISRKGTDFNMPTQKAMNSGLFEIKETVIAHSDGHTSISKTAKVTGYGQTYFVNRFLGKSIQNFS